MKTGAPRNLAQLARPLGHKPEIDAHPIAVIEDRYGGCYSGGSWFAIAKANEPVDASKSRAQFCLLDENGPSGGDMESRAFWNKPPNWIATGTSPDKAWVALKQKSQRR